MIELPVMLLAVHFIADFPLQTDWMALNKSKRWDALALHVTVYSACFLLFGVTFAAMTFASHFITDALTSRATSALWQRNQRHWFFVMIGFDQLIHASTLALAWNYLR